MKNFFKQFFIIQVFQGISRNGSGVEGIRTAMRASAERMIGQNIIQGYLAYDDDISIGWCNANDKKCYQRVGEFYLDDEPAETECPALARDDGTLKIKSITCFEISPEYRGKGIASALLERVCTDAALDGYDKVEAYPVMREQYEALDFTGPISI